MNSTVQEKSRKRIAPTLLVVPSALMFAASSALAQQATQTQQPQQQQQVQQQQQPQVAQQCLEDLRTLQSELQATAFGAFRPGVADPAWGAAAPPAGTAAPAAGAETAAQPEAAVGADPWGAWGAGAWGTGAPVRQEMHALMHAAHIMAARGNEQGCQAAVQEMQAMAGEWQQMIEADPDEPMAWRRGHLEAALPAEEAIGVMRAQDLMGADVRNMQDEHLGSIEDVVLDPHDRSVRYALVARGGFLGIGTELVPVRWEDLLVTPDRRTFVLNVTEEAIEQAPSADDPQFFVAAEDDWWQQVEQYWEQTIAG